MLARVEVPEEPEAVDVFVQVSSSAAKLAQIGASSMLVVTAGWMIIHGTYLALNMLAVRSLRLGSFLGKDKWKVEVPVVLVGSQKTLPVAVTVLSQLGSVIGEVGLAVVPCIMCHMLQIVIDSFFVAKYTQLRRRETETAQ
ncbi:hypothetical protein CYMTET_16454 [Cymbomonas tetramitiformis]|uniref:Uncharacterized protein n=1 Tax=Cymbomonas tetramitiformis TaxID=36881 RepID=A0AAE0L8A3_9CHLO|nr:hypothetical protein CYMTET_16454 [Cymbomonas tetramitiformis]